MRAYSTLTSVILLIAFLTIIILGVNSQSLSSILSRYDESAGTQTQRITESCFEEVMRRLRTSLDYSGGTIPLNSTQNCTATVTGDLLQKTVVVTASESGFQQSITAIIDISTSGEAINFTVSDWQEN